MVRTWRLKVLIAVVLVALGIAGYWKYQYPYGRTHRCSRALYIELEFYASEHDGKYPTGEASPEASLSLLYREGQGNAETLAGRAKSGEVARRILESGGLLGPDTCDWHYVEGLTQSDHGMIAILWDKSSLGHRGERLHGGHEVVRLDGSFEVIPADKWSAFLAKQKELLAGRHKQKPSPAP